MATGYTYYVAEKDVSFEEFVWHCARAFGPFMHMRDDRAIAPIRMPDTDYYYKESLLKAQSNLQMYSNMSLEEAEILSQKEYDTSLKNIKEALLKSQLISARYNNMLEKVICWDPPSKEHQGLKTFMIEQLQNSIKHDCDTSYYSCSINNLTKLPASKWLKDKILEEKNDIRNYSERIAKEEKDIQFSIDWINNLKNSVPIPSDIFCVK
jgi:hypothetical protein